MTLSENLFYDGYKDEQFCFRVHLRNYVLNYPGLNKVFCCTGAGALQGFMWCESIGESPTHCTCRQNLRYAHFGRLIRISLNNAHS